MGFREIFLTALPVTIAIALLLVVAMRYKSFDSSGDASISSLAASSSSTAAVTVGSGDSDCSCPDYITDLNCGTTTVPVLGGVDFVQYFTDFSSPDGSYDETQTGVVGSSSYQTTYNGYTFYFLSQTNKDIFDSNPTTYMPQYGGFCAWGVAGETCPQYPWDADCLGPNGNWGHWTIQNQRLYFFFKAEAKAKFMDDPSTWISSGNTRWGTWYPSNDYFSTKCYVSVADDDSTTRI